MNEHTKQAKAIYDKFKALHPNAGDEFTDNIADVARWHWHIIEHENRQKRSIEMVVPGLSKDANEYIENTKVEKWDDMPVNQQIEFIKLASLFPGRVVFATGSRVTGGWIEKESARIVKEWRAQMGKSDKDVSDYDLFIELFDGEDLSALKNRLPSNADLLLSGAEKKIQIPMWDFSKLPKSEHARVIDLFNKSAWGDLMDIHNTYSLSNHHYCCEPAPVIRWFKYAIEEGIIKGE